MDLVTQLFALLPERYMTAANFVLLVVMLLGRSYHSIRSGGGLAALWRGLIYGSNTPKQ